MQIHQFRIGLTVYTLDADNASFYDKRGEVVQIRSGLDEAEGRVVVDFDGLPLTEFKPSELTTVKPMSFAKTRAVLAELQDKVSTLEVETHNQKGHIDLLEAQAVERSRKLDLAKALADQRAVDTARMTEKLKQADNQILRHETSIKDLRAELQRVQDKHDHYQQRTIEKSHEIENLERGLTAANAALEAAQKSNDNFANEAVKQAEKVGALQRENNHLTEQAGIRDRIIQGWEKRSEEDTSIITSLRSQIESLQSIQESMKMMQEGHAPAIKKLQGELHNALHQRDQHKQNSAYWKGQAMALGYVMPNMAPVLDKLPPTYEARIAKIESFLGQQFESFN